MQAYHTAVLRHPGLTILTFRRPAVFTEQAKRITEETSILLAEAGLSTRRSQLWINILVDFTHGAALATAMGGRSVTQEPVEDPEYEAALEELLIGLDG